MNAVGDTCSVQGSATVREQQSSDCDCLDLIYDKLTTRLGADADVELQLNCLWTLNPDRFIADIRAALPPLYFSYFDRAKNGRLLKRRKNSYIFFKFCPFCGKAGRPTRKHPDPLHLTS